MKCPFPGPTATRCCSCSCHFSHFAGRVVCCCFADVTGKESSSAVDGRVGGRADDGSRRDWRSAGRRRDDGAGGEDQGASDADTVEDSLLGDSDENGRGRHRPSRGHRHGHQRSSRGHRTRHAPNTSSYRIFIALFDYNPVTMSPNRDAVDEELAFYEGQLLKVSITRRVNSKTKKTFCRTRCLSYCGAECN